MPVHTQTDRQTSRQTERHTKSVAAAGCKEVCEGLMWIDERCTCDVKSGRVRVAELWSNLAGARSRYGVGCKLERAACKEAFARVVYYNKRPLCVGCKFSGNLIFLEIFRKFPEILAKAWKI